MSRLAHKFALLLALTSLFLSPAFAFAQTPSLSLTVTPPIIQVTQAPGSDWSSALRVVNTNHYDIHITTEVLDFHPDGETGNAVFEEGAASPASDTRRMSGWIELPADSITVMHDATGLVPFTIHVPKNADPGGHYAAILVGTKAGGVEGGSGAGVSTMISSLVFLRVPGEVIEDGAIRDFYAENEWVESPEQSFVLRFENKGNVHLIPQGQIVVTNMWGKERGKIEINDVNTFGNVLPQSTRKFEFHWSGENNPLEFGRYKAEASLAYGEDGRQSVDRVTYFWVIPLKPVAATIATLIFFIWFITWAIRRYIRKALAIEREMLGIPESAPVKGRTTAAVKEIKPEPRLTFEALKRPLVSDSLDLRRSSSVSIPQTATRSQPVRQKPTLMRTLRRYRHFIGFIFVVLLGFGFVGFYFYEVFQDERSYKVEKIKTNEAVEFVKKPAE